MAINSEEAISSVVDGNNAFALDLYHQLTKQKENFFFSPYSLSTALAMTYAGARGETAAQMAEVLHFNLKQEQLHPAFAALIDDLDSNQQGYQLNIANRLWGAKDQNFLDTFLKITQDYYKAALEKLDFAGATEEARERINSWVAQQTQEKIQDLIVAGVLDALTQLVLTNAIYFKGDWESPFDSADTQDLPFTVAPGQQVNVPMMHQTGEFSHSEKGVQLLELPYVGDRLSMVILLPNEVDGLAKLEQQLSIQKLEEWLSSSYKQTVSIWLPKFKLTSEFQLNKTLSEMGMPLAFGGGADFSGMIGSQDLYISNVIHKAFVDVNEEGTEAAAATAVVMSRSIPPTFKADHPFIFLIWDTQSGSIPFLGRVVNPSVSN